MRGFPAYGLVDWLDERAVALITALYGNCPAWLLSAFFSSATPMQRMLGKHMGLERFNERNQYARVPAFRQWLDTDVPIAGALFRELVIDIFRKNSLACSGLKVGSEVVDLKRIRCPVLNVVADLDIIVDPRSCLPLTELVGSGDKINLRFPTGHLGVALGQEAHAMLWPQIGEWLKERDS